MRKTTVQAALSLAASLMLAFTTLSVAGTPGTLYWTNGDSLPGELLSASDSRLGWQSTLFSTPFSIDISALQNATFGDMRQPVANKERLRFVTHDGQVLYGDLVDIRGDELLIESERLGSLALNQAAVRSFRQLENETFIYVGPTGKDGWKTLKQARSVDDWEANNFGHLSTGVVGAELFRQLQLPAVTQIDISLRWIRKPGFVITFSDPDAIRLSKQTIKLETWDDELVLQTLATTGDFEQLKTLTKDQKQVQLRLLWNQETGELSVYTPFGELLGKMTAGREVEKLRSGFYIQNKGSDLTLEHISVASWSGAVPSKIVEGQSFIQLNGGDVLNGQITDFDSDAMALKIKTGGVEQSVPLAKITSVDFGKQPQPEDAPQLQLVYSDGTLLRGELQSIEDGRIVVRSRISNLPIRAKADDLRELRFLQASRVDATDDLLKFNNAKLHGTLAPADDEGTLGWKPVGSDNAAPLPTTHTATIQRAAHPDQKKHGLTDIIYLKSGEVIPCEIIAIEEDQIDIRTSFTSENRQIDHKRVKAISLHTESEFIASAFDERNWNVLEGKDKVEFADNTAKFGGQATISLARSVRGGMDIAFDAEWSVSQPSAMYFSFSGKNVNERAPQHDFLIYFLQQQVAARGLRRPNGRGMVARQHMFGDGKARIAIRHEDKNIVVTADDHNVLTFPRTLNDRGGGVLQIQIQQIGGRRLVGNNPQASLLKLSNLQMGRVGGTLATSRVDAEKKKLVLTVPRMRKQNPPTHILVATNGDLLRGRLLQLNDAAVYFQSRLEKMVLPRKRLAAVVWLDESASDLHAIPEDELKVNTTFVNGAQFTFIADRMTDSDIIGQHELFGDCKVPLDSLNELAIGHSVESARLTPFADWKLTAAQEPKFAGSSSADGGPTDEGFGLDSPLIGTPAPDFGTTLLSGETFDLEDYRNDVIVLDFWATWCGPCIKAMPDLMEVADAFKDKNVHVIAVNQQENKDVIEQFLSDREWELNVGLDPNGTIGRLFNVEGIPQTVVIGPGGKIERLHIGFHSKLKDELTNVINDLLEEPKDNVLEDLLEKPNDEARPEDQAAQAGPDQDFETKLVQLKIVSGMR